MTALHILARCLAWDVERYDLRAIDSNLSLSSIVIKMGREGRVLEGSLLLLPQSNVAEEGGGKGEAERGSPPKTPLNEGRPQTPNPPQGVGGVAPIS